MEKGDIGFVFPDVIHHYQVLTPGVNKATYLIASPFTIAKFADIMQSMAPEYPIIKAEKVEPEVYRVIKCNFREQADQDITICTGISSNCVGTLHRKIKFVEKSSVGSKYVLSRLFSKTFHRNLINILTMQG